MQLCPSSGVTLISDAGPQKPIGFALRIASALLGKLANNSCLWLTRAFG